MPLTPVRRLRQFRYAVSFDGVDDYVIIGDPPSLRILGDITLEAWAVIPTGQKLHAIILGKYHGARIATNIDVRFQCGSYLVGLGWRWLFTPIPSRTDWLHIVYVRRGRTWHGIYVNGELKVSSTIEDANINYMTYPWCVGVTGDLDFNRYAFRGAVNGVHIYNRALTPDEITHNYLNPNNPVREGLVLFLIAHPTHVSDIDNDGILEWIDLSGNGNHGKMYGATLVELIKPPARVLAAARVLPAAR